MTTVYVEGDTDVPFVKQVCEHAGIILALDPYPMRGKNNLDPKLPKLAQAGRSIPILAFRDLDQDAACASTWLAANLSPLRPGPLFCLRLAVRAVEAWFLADRAHAAECLRVPLTAIPLRPDEEPDPKQTIVALARKSSNKTLKEGLVPAPGVSRKTGPGYEGWLIASAEAWSVARARTISPSLHRTIERLASSRDTLNKAARLA